jgi:hypothetical protein
MGYFNPYIQRNFKRKIKNMLKRVIFKLNNERFINKPYKKRCFGVFWGKVYKGFLSRFSKRYCLQ